MKDCGNVGFYIVGFGFFCVVDFYGMDFVGNVEDGCFVEVIVEFFSIEGSWWDNEF